MDQEYREKIRENLPALIKNTKCSATFLAIFHSKNIFSGIDVEAIETEVKNYGPTVGSKKFYDLLVTKTNSIDVLFHALKETNQSGVLSILKGSSNYEIQTKHKMFTPKPPTYITEYIQDQGERYLIVCSDDCELTCKRILESTPNSKLYTANEMLEKLAFPTDSVASVSILLTNLEENLAPFYTIEPPTTLKAVFVTHVNENDLQNKLPDPKDWWKIVHDNIQWNDLSSVKKHDIISRLGTCLGLEGLQLTKALNNVDSKMLIDLLKGHVVESEGLFNETIPKPLSYYYVKRTLQTRYIITKKIFQEDRTSDFLLFSGIEKPVLSDLCRKKGTDTSSNLIQNKRTVSPIIFLETSADFEIICNRFPETSVHLFNFEDGGFVWKRTRGSIAAIQDCVAPEQKTLKESEFISEILSQSNLSPICISDTPGKGKSVLLAAIAIELKKHHTNGLVGFIRIKELMQKFKENQGDSPTVNIAVSVISSFLSSSPLGYAYLNNKKEYLKELLLDGFDEVTADNTKLGYDCLKVIRSAFKDTRIWITSRPHMLPELERVLETLGYNITPFSIEDQVEFLSSYWKKCIAGCRKDEVSKFAGECLENIKSNLGKKHKDIAGIPLQCFLIAEAFKDDAKRFLEGSSSKYLSPIIASITDLYEKLIEKKLADFRYRYNSNNLDKSEIFIAHMHLAMQFLYPKNLQKFSDNLSHKMSTQEILDFGLVEAINNYSTFRFLHTTFAEYFVALFVSEFLCKNNYLLDFLLNDVMKTNRFKITLETCTGFEHYINLRGVEFTNYVICYFLNSFVEEKELIFPHGYISLTCLRSIAEASVYHKYENIFRKLILFNELKSHIINEGFLCKALYWGNVSLLEIVIREYVLRNDATPPNKINFSFLDTQGNYRKYDTFSTHEKQFSLLHLAMKKGEYTTVEFLMENYFRELVEKNEKGEYNKLVHELLLYSHGHNEWNIAERKHIINYLARVNMDLLVVEDSDELFPVEVDFIHTDLIKEILTVAKKFYMKRNVLNRLFTHFLRQENESFSNFLKAVFTSLDQCEINSVFNTSWSCCLLKQVSRNCVVTTEILEFLKKNCSKFCCVDITCKIEAIVNARKHDQRDSVMEWLSSYLIQTKEDLKVILAKFINLGFSGTFSNLLKYLPRQDTPNEIPFVIEAFKLVFSDTNPTNCENIRTSMHLIGFCVEIFLSKVEIKSDLETSDIDSVDLGLKYCQELQNKNLINCFQSCLIKLCWISCFRKYLTQQNFERRLKSSLGDGVMRTNDTFGNNLLHVFASYFEFSYFNFQLNKGGFLNRLDFYVRQLWEVLVENSFNILQCNDHHLTPIGLLPTYCYLNETSCSAILFAAKHMAAQKNWNISDAHKFFYLVIKHHNIWVVEEVYKWYSDICHSQNVKISQVVVSFGDETSNYLDAAIDNGCSEVVEFVNTDLQIFSPMLAPSPLCIHKSILKGWSFNSITFIANVAEMFPSEIRRLVNTSKQQNLVPLSLPRIGSHHVSLLHKLGADVNTTDNNGNTPLHFALKRDKLDLKVVEELIKCGANVNAPNSCQETPLSIFVLNDNAFAFECFEKLIENGADPFIKDKMGNTPVHRLFENICYGHKLHKCVESIIKNKIEHVLTLKNNEGRTPLELADINFYIPKKTKKLLKNYNIII